MIVNSSVDLSIRKAAIIRKINHPGVITARQSSDYIQDQLHLAGFTGVFVHENLENLSIESILNYSDGFELNDYQLGDQQIGDVYSFYSDCFETFQLGDYQIGDSQLNSYKWCNFVANHIDMEIDSHFFISPENRTFVIGGVDFGTFGTVDSDRTKEFRQLILKLKPVNSVALLLINYT